ncbi:MAG: non-processive endocellulase, partial [Verrucomicrobiales bacterium]|nr:non-processive endocellulase [Verrucomicrobiales bacterium]
MSGLKLFIAFVPLFLLGEPRAFSQSAVDATNFPRVGDFAARLITPDLVELSFVLTKPEGQPVPAWNFVDGAYKFHAPPASDFSIKSGTNRIAVKEIGFKRRPVYAPLKERDLRIGNYLYLRLTRALAENEEIQLESPNPKALPNGRVTLKADPRRWTPVIHVNQEGYLPKDSKKAFLGHFLGSMGELSLTNYTSFQVVEAESGKEVFTGSLTAHPDQGFSYDVMPYQLVVEADFSALQKSGEYRLQVSGLGVSYPFRIDEGYAGVLARTFALGLYHQRCGTDNKLPFTRFTHGVCHTNLVEVPDNSFETMNSVLADMSSNFASNPRHTAPQLKSFAASLYPFVNHGKFDGSGGHHDAGDYSKYTINVAQLIHVLVFAADAFPGAGELDNLGLPESGDGKSDLLQEAKWEADFLGKLQDGDGGFYFLVYPKERQYEHDVLPDFGDAQVVFPKTTAATAAAVAALAQAASSPLFKKQFPKEAELYLNKAKRGWSFLEKAFAKFGRDGSYQKITHYGDEFSHDDEIAWAATELYLATGEEKFHKELLEHFDPSKTETKRWNWVRMFESYGCAMRSYAFGAITKRVTKDKLDDQFFRQCENEIIAHAQSLTLYANQSAYGTSFPSETKRFRNAGWYFSSDAAFDLAVACALDYPAMNDPRREFRAALLENFSYELGCNPVHVSYVPGLGRKRPREMVNQYSQNDRRALPPTGLLWGNIQEGFAYMDIYKKELSELTFPPDWHEKNPYPFYDRWGDSFNTTTEFVTVNIAKAAAAASFLMGSGPLKTQPWKAINAEIKFSEGTNGRRTAELIAGGIDLSQAH